ncbi:hypothetical protein QH494_13405 [Sphingomonas sp. AR_OL41]|uniref:hypothetical protein n=1 Tax=Sphingomonas sp. AR_OL41 TaxID=3042729 RepID=UPI002480120A|nr:hypothetical protein [Sphingomonas sp. AR_OL41]MDH7973179.1 hypothetical protein [Sphingomonas sp. AR_OL41]
MRWRNGFAIGLLALFATPASGQTYVPRDIAPVIESIDPLTVADEDFARSRDPEAWEGLSVSRISFREGPVTWRLWRIANLRHRDGPLWVLPHDNENATFAAALIAVRSWGGVVIAVDSDPVAHSYAARFNTGAGAAPVDPNRNFYDALPLYAGTILADLGMPPRLIVALHTNEPGFDASLSSCPHPPYGGSGTISIKLCTARFHPRASVGRAWPFDDDDTLALVPYPVDGDPRGAFCARRLGGADFNIVFERVTTSDGSLSNYASLHGLRYVNLETAETGSTPVGLAGARNRLVAMIDRMMTLCGDGPTLALSPPAAHLATAGRH